MRAFHGDSAVKEKYLARLKAHHAARTNHYRWEAKTLIELLRAAPQGE